MSYLAMMVFESGLEHTPALLDALDRSERPGTKATQSRCGTGSFTRLPVTAAVVHARRPDIDVTGLGRDRVRRRMPIADH
jgi:hypothetical protein